MDTNDGSRGVAPADAVQAGAVGGAECPMPNVMRLIGGKWKLPILKILIFDGTQRFGALRRRIDGITQTMLTGQLRALEADGLVTRTVYAEVPPRVEYTATRAGLELAPVFHAMHAWWQRRAGD